MSKIKLSKEEQELLDSVESGQIRSVLSNKRRKELQSAAEHTFKKDKRINVRISNRDLIAIQSRASQEGIAYQTLVSSILHKYISGTLTEVSTGKRKH